MRSARTCSHIKSNGVLCGSPALRHQTRCYFHHRWQKRQQQIARMAGPFGTNQQHGVELPILEGPESIMIAIMEIQHALLDNRITHKTATALLYSIQLAIQVKLPLNSLAHRFDSITDFDEDPATPQPAHEPSALPTTLSSRPGRAVVARGAEGPASPQPAHEPCHPERSAASSRGVEGSFVPSPEAPGAEKSRTPGIKIQASATSSRPKVPQIANTVF